MAEIMRATRAWRSLAEPRDAIPSLVVALRDILSVPDGAVVCARPHGLAEGVELPEVWTAWGVLAENPAWFHPVRRRWPDVGGPTGRWVAPPDAWAWAGGASRAGIWLFGPPEGPQGFMMLARPLPLADDDSDTISGMALYIDVVLELVEQRRRAENLSNQDALTGTLNRRGLQAAWQERVAAARRHRRALVLVLADVNNLKGINDSQGHLAGDRTLRRAADQLRLMLRDDDAVGRWGGDEFVALLTMERAEAGAVVERVSRQLSTADVPASVGAAVLGIDGSSWAECFEAADRRCYARKPPR
jgi:diguanylate cyclase (GGDEF)-like protein